MNFSIARLFGGGDVQASSGPRDPSSDFWYVPVGAATPAGVHVSRTLAFQVPAVIACLEAIAAPIASLPLKVYRRRPDGSKERLAEHPVWRLFGRAPGMGLTPVQHRTQMLFDLLLDRNYFARVRLDAQARPVALQRMAPDSVTIQHTPAGHVFRWTHGGRTELVDPEEVFHISSAPFDDTGVFGLSRLVSARRTIGKAAALADYAERFFANDATPPLVLKMAKNFTNDEDRKAFMQSWQQARSGSNRHKAALLEYGIEVEQLAIDNDKAQFLETAKETDLALARIFRVPPHKIGILDKATFSNIEHQALEFVTDTLAPWLALVEQSIQRDFLMSNEADVFVEFDVAGLLRGDLKARYDAYAIARNWGWLSVNEIRKLENLNPVADGDKYLEPLNMAPAGGLPDAASATPQIAPQSNLEGLSNGQD